MKAYCSIVVGQEIDGHNAVVKVERVSCDKSKIDEIVNKGQASWIENFEVPEGNVKMFFQRNAQEIEIEDVPQ
jgi:hypothetical protein